MTLRRDGIDEMTTSGADAIRTVAVLGGGTMGNGIAHVFARSGYTVILRDVEQRFLDRALETISKNLDREIKKGVVPRPTSRRFLRASGRSRTWWPSRRPTLWSRPFPSGWN